MNTKQKGVVAAGHEVTATAAIEMLEVGGNAYDAILAAYLTACHTEPVLASLGGGGYLLVHTVQGDATLYDFFTHTPRSNELSRDVDFFPLTVDFGTVTQDFHVGTGSVAVPGGVRGVIEIHKELGSLPLHVVVEPAKRAARNGVTMNEYQAHIFDLVRPIFCSTKELHDIYRSTIEPDNLLRAGEVSKNPAYADFLARFALEGDTPFYEGDIAEHIARDMKEKGGYLTVDDLRTYRVERRTPVSLPYRGATFLTNPPPSSGGLLIAFALRLLEKTGEIAAERDSIEFLATLAELMDVVNVARKEHVDGMLQKRDVLDSFLAPDVVAKYVKELSDRVNHWGSTTQISVIDGEGNVASMTTSNGEGSGYVVPGTGIVLNNMLGEEDLHPHGFHKWTPNQRISSMMSPSVVLTEDGRQIAIGSGGSNRIRTAILQTLVNMLDFGMSPQEAVTYPRIHHERGELNVEPGFDEGVTDVLCSTFDNAKIWDSQSIFFGGVHVAVRDTNSGECYGGGDMRRGGTVRIAGA